MFSRIFEAKKKAQSFGIELVEISKDFLIFISILLKIVETRFDSEPVSYFEINILFAVGLTHERVNTLNYALIFYPVMNIS